jgi:hypothetical protein
MVAGLPGIIVMPFVDEFCTEKLPAEFKLSIVAPVEEDIVSGFVFPEPTIERVADGVFVPTPSLEVVLFQNKLALLCEILPLVPMNGIDPEVRAER